MAVVSDSGGVFEGFGFNALFSSAVYATIIAVFGAICHGGGLQFLGTIQLFCTGDF